MDLKLLLRSMRLGCEHVFQWLESAEQEDEQEDKQARNRHLEVSPGRCANLKASRRCFE